LRPSAFEQVLRVELVKLHHRPAASEFRRVADLEKADQAAMAHGGSVRSAPDRWLATRPRDGPDRWRADEGGPPDLNFRIFYSD
jgi:hypothetical protein